MPHKDFANPKLLCIYASTSLIIQLNIKYNWIQKRQNKEIQDEKKLNFYSQAFSFYFYIEG